jgi:acetyl-CoA/propionyl-CoA carboxylase biotin carboxyl carrier protein
MIGKLLIANRGEIAVRVIRAAADLGIRSVAVYTEPDREALHTRLADEAYALTGPPTAAHLDIGAIIAVARRAGADSIHPGYGFLSENADFAAAVIDAGLIWVGPPPSAIRILGDKVSARKVARRVGAPIVTGTPTVVSDVAEVERFAREHGLPIAIKAAHGGGGRGLRVVRAVEEIHDQFRAATAEAELAFGNGECFLERFLDRARHVETQCLADSHGVVAVIGTRDCSVQRRHQKVIEESPAPFLTEDQHRRLVEASEAILGAVGYIGAATCEFLLAADGTLTFLEVNTRLQVEHPVTEEVTGVDLVVEQFRIAAGERLAGSYPAARGHAIEFRINAEDAARGFLPTPGPITRWAPPSGPGVRLDSGVVEGDKISGNFDSMLAKLIVRGVDRQQALRRARRALAEFEIDGLATLLPFHRLVVGHPDFAPVEPGSPFTVHTQWIENALGDQIPPHPPVALSALDDQPAARRQITIEVNGRRVEVVAPADLAPAPPTRSPRRPSGSTARRRTLEPVPGDGALISPMQGTVVRVLVNDGQEVTAGAAILVLEAMKMEQQVLAPQAGTVSGLTISVGQTLSAGTLICRVQN